MDSSDKTNVWKMFDQIAKTYDQVNWIVSFGQDQQWRKKVGRYLPPRPHLNLLDLATGTGDQIIALLNAGRSIRRIVGIDLSEEMMEIGREKLAKTSYRNRVEFIRADAQQLPFADRQFDASTFAFGIRNVPDPLLALKEIRRVLKPNGRALVLEFSMPHGWIRPLFLFYLRRVLPRMGGFFSKNLKAYRYLNQTIESFPSGEQFHSLLREAGFQNIRSVSMNFGAVTLYIGDRLE